MKFKKLAYLLPLVTCLVSGCSFFEKEPDEPAFNGEVNLFNFDGWGPGYQTVVLINNFGRVSENYDTKYVKSGNGSALLQPIGNIPAKKEPVVYWPLVSNVFGYNYSNLTCFEKVDVDFFNADDKDIDVTVGFIAGVTTITNVALGKGDTFTLKANEWTHVEYKPNISALNTYIDITNAKGLYFKFPLGTSSDVNKAPKVYVDEIKMTNGQEPKKIVDMFHIKKNSICDFEDDICVNHISVNNIVSEHLTAEVVGAQNGVNPSQGKKMLHIRNKGMQGRWVNWSKVTFSQAYMSKTDMVKLPESEVENGQWVVRYEVFYKDAEGRINAGNAFPEFTSSTGNVQYMPRQDFTANKWTTVSVSMNTRENIYGGSYIIPTECILQNAAFGWTIGNEEYDCDIYIDNIRLVKIV